jgi:monothiol glutaredoxin
MSIKIPLPIANPDFGSAPPEPAAGAATLKTRAEGGDLVSEIKKETSENAVFLYMKGTPDSPMCGFSARVVQILQHLDVPFASFNILSDPEKRETIKQVADWPTFPQLYVKGELVGGCDIVTEMFQTGELAETING